MPKHVVIFSDGIGGHYHQSLGVAEWLNRLCGADVETVDVPRLSWLKRFMMTKLKSRALILGEHEPDTLFISTGSSAAPFCLATARHTGNRSAVIMTPSILGTRPFDYAIIPEHDPHDPSDPHVLVTLGAPNHVYAPELAKTGARFFSGFPHKKVLSLLIGGSDANYKPDSAWARRVLSRLSDIKDVTLLITTSRRTGAALDSEIEAIFANNHSVGYMLLLSRRSEAGSLNAMLGVSTHVIVTEDSVSMVSEAATAGFKVGLLRVPRVTGRLKGMLGYGAKRFDDMFARMMDEGLIDDLGSEPDFVRFLEPSEQKHGREFNEAKRAAEWILSHEDSLHSS